MINFREGISEFTTLKTLCVYCLYVLIWETYFVNVLLYSMLHVCVILCPCINFDITLTPYKPVGLRCCISMFW